jgi:hypothetical protein
MVEILDKFGCLKSFATFWDKLEKFGYIVVCCSFGETMGNVPGLRFELDHSVRRFA